MTTKQYKKYKTHSCCTFSVSENRLVSVQQNHCQISELRLGIFKFSRLFLCKVDMLTFCPSLWYMLLTFPAESSRSRGTNVKRKKALCLATSMPLFHIFKYSEVNKQLEVHNLNNSHFILIVKFPRKKNLQSWKHLCLTLKCLRVPVKPAELLTILWTKYVCFSMRSVIGRS